MLNRKGIADQWKKLSPEFSAIISLFLIWRRNDNLKYHFHQISIDHFAIKLEINRAKMFTKCPDYLFFKPLTPQVSVSWLVLSCGKSLPWLKVHLFGVFTKWRLLLQYIVHGFHGQHQVRPVYPHSLYKQKEWDIFTQYNRATGYVHGWSVKCCIARINKTNSIWHHLCCHTYAD